jgi:hypothetical protein
MAYNFLNTTTYTKDLEMQQEIMSQLAQAQQQSQLGSGFDSSPFDSDLIEMVSQNEQMDQMSPNEDLIEAPSVNEEDISDNTGEVDMDIINSLFQDAPEAPQRIRSYTPPPSAVETPPAHSVSRTLDEEAEDDGGGSQYDANGKVKPRIWQYGGKPTKYQFGGGPLGDPAQTGMGDIYTPLPKGPKFTPQQEEAYQKWKQKLPQRLQYEGNYNLRQFWYDVPNTPISPNMHFPDFYKMPNHESFSAHSQYMTPTNRYLGGKWTESDSAWDYQPYNDYYKPPIHEAKLQNGGTLYANDYETQRIGLNNPNFDTAVLNLKGKNTIRGLDNYEPVAVTDGSKYQVLHGPQDTAKFNGKVYEKRLGKMQSGGVANDIKSYYNEYLNSPNYTKRLQKQGYTDPQQAILDRAANLKATGYMEDDLLESQYSIPNNMVIINPNDAKAWGMPISTMTAHEFGHVTGGADNQFPTKPNLQLNANEVDYINKRNKARTMDTTGMTEEQKLDQIHDSRPAETRGDLDALRYRLFKDKLYNTGTEDFTPEHLKQAKEKYKDDNMVNRLFKNYSDKDLIDLMNNIAYNKQNNRSYGQA